MPIAEQPRHTLPSVLAGTIVGNHPRKFDLSKSVVKLPAGDKISVEYDLGAMEFELQTAVENNPKKEGSPFTRQVEQSASIPWCV